MKKLICSQCKRSLTNDEIAFSLHVLGRGSACFLCISCMAEYFECEYEIIKNKIDMLKCVGCDYFKQKYVK